MVSSALRNCRVLVVEDEYLIAVSLRDHLQAIGSTVIGPVPSVEKAMRLIESNQRIDVAILDINLRGVMVYPVADVLLIRNVPFVFASGYEGIPDRYSHVRKCLKPYRFPEMHELLVSALAG
jgi:two-component SAPR family response regulator